MLRLPLGLMLALTLMLLTPLAGVVPPAGPVLNDETSTPAGVDARSITWTEMSLIRDSAGEGTDWFGSSVAFSGDTIAVGSPESNQSGTFSQGSVFIFDRDQGGAENWGMVTEIVAADGTASDFFGTSLALDGDTLAVYAPLSDQNGAVYIFERDLTGADAWGQRTKLIDPVAANGEQFGWDIDLDGDDLIVGEPFYGDTELLGQAVLFSRDEGGADSWGLVTNLTASDAFDFSDYGASVAIDGDLIAIGSPAEWEFNDPGRVYLYGRNQGGSGMWGEIAIVNDTVNGVAGDMLGAAVALDGTTLVAGAPAHGGDGAAYVFEKDQGGTDMWGQVAKLGDSNGSGWSTYGGAVAIDGEHLVIGADLNEPGRAFVHARNETGTDAWGLLQNLTASDADQWDQFGTAVDIVGTEIVVGARGDSWGGQIQAGSTYLFGEQVAQQTSPLELVAWVNDTTTAEDSAFPESYFFALNATSYSISPSDSFLTIGTTGGAVTGTPTNAHVGLHTFTLTAAGPDDALNHTFTVNVTNVAPIISGMIDTETPQFLDYEIDLDSSDDGDGTITWSMDTDAGWLSLDTAAGTLSGRPMAAGTWNVTVSVDDGNGGMGHLNSTIEVIEFNHSYLRTEGHARPEFPPGHTPSLDLIAHHGDTLVLHSTTTSTSYESSGGWSTTFSATSHFDHHHLHILELEGGTWNLTQSIEVTSRYIGREIHQCSSCHGSGGLGWEGAHGGLSDNNQLLAADGIVAFSTYAELFVLEQDASQNDAWVVTSTISEFSKSAPPSEVNLLDLTADGLLFRYVYDWSTPTVKLVAPNATGEWAVRASFDVDVTEGWWNGAEASLDGDTIAMTARTGSGTGILRIHERGAARSDAWGEVADFNRATDGIHDIGASLAVDGDRVLATARINGTTSNWTLVAFERDIGDGMWMMHPTDVAFSSTTTPALELDGEIAILSAEVDGAVGVRIHHWRQFGAGEWGLIDEMATPDARGHFSFDGSQIMIGSRGGQLAFLGLGAAVHIPAVDGIAIEQYADYAYQLDGSHLGDDVNFTLVSGPDWLSLGPDGWLNGTPVLGEVTATLVTVHGNGSLGEATMSYGLRVLDRAPGLTPLPWSCFYWMAWEDYTCELVADEPGVEFQTVTCDDWLDRTDCTQDGVYEDGSYSLSRELWQEGYLSLNQTVFLFYKSTFGSYEGWTYDQARTHYMMQLTNGLLNDRGIKLVNSEGSQILKPFQVELILPVQAQIGQTTTVPVPGNYDVNATPDGAANWTLHSDATFLTIDPLTGVVSASPTSSDDGNHLIRRTWTDGNITIHNFTAVKVGNLPALLTPDFECLNMVNGEAWTCDFDADQTVTWQGTAYVPFTFLEAPLPFVFIDAATGSIDVDSIAGDHLLTTLTPGVNTINLTLTLTNENGMSSVYTVAVLWQTDPNFADDLTDEEKDEQAESSTRKGGKLPGFTMAPVMLSLLIAVAFIAIRAQREDDDEATDHARQRD